MILAGIVEGTMAHATPVSELTWIAFSSRNVDRKKNRIFQDSDPGDTNQDLQTCMSTLWAWVKHFPK
jgi:hypothetical protein